MKTVLLIDLSGLLHPAYHANERGPVSVTFEASIGGVHRCISKAPEGSLVAICLDSRTSWRKLMAPSYKADRERLPEVFYTMSLQVQERLQADGHLLWTAAGFESDDIIATATKKATKAGHDVIIASTDKDMARLLCSDPGAPQVKQLKLSTFEFFTAADVVTKWEIEPPMVTDFLGLCGDTADGIKGCPGVGPKKAAPLLKAYGSIEGIYKALDGGTLTTTPAIAAALAANRDQVNLAYRLAELRFDVPIKFEEIYEKREILPLVQTEEEPMEDDPFKRVPHNDPPMAAQDAGQQAQQQQMQSDCSGLAKGLAAPEGLHTAKGAPAAALQEATKGTIEQSPEDLLTSLLQKKGFAPVEFEKALEPRDGDALVRLAKNLFNSRIYSRYPTWESMCAVMQRGRAMGLGSIASLDCFDIIDTGSSLQAAPKAQLIIHLAQKDPNCEYLYCMESDAKHATWETKHRRNPGPSRFTYTIEQAEAAGLLKVREGKQPGNWHTRPEDMLVKTGGSKLARREYPGATLGLIPAEDMIGGDDNG